MNKVKKLFLILLSAVSIVGLCCTVPLMTMSTKGEDTSRVELDGSTDSSVNNTIVADYITVAEDFTLDATTGAITGFSEIGKEKISGKSHVKLRIPAQIGEVTITEVSYLAWEEFCTHLEITDIDNTYNIPWNIWDGTANAFTMSGGSITAVSTSFKNKIEGKSEPALVNLIFPSPIKYYENNAFSQYNEIQISTKNLVRNNKNLESMLFSAGITLIGQETIKGNSIKNLYFATGRKNVLYIDKQAFQGSTGLKTIIFSAGVYLLQGGRAFQEVTTINEIYIASEQNSSSDKNPYVPQFYITGSSGALYTNEYTYEANVTASEKYTIHDNFNSHQQLVFVPSGFTEFDFPNAHTTEIGSHAFVGSQIGVLQIPDRITKIEQWAFRFSSIANIYLPSNATYGSKVFESTTALTTIIAPSPQAYEALSKLDSRVTYEINVSYEINGVIIKTDTILFGQNFYNFRKNETTGIYEASTYTLPTDSSNWYFGKDNTTLTDLEISSVNLQSFFGGTLAGASYYSTNSSGVGILYKNITLTSTPTEVPIINKHVIAPIFQANVGNEFYGELPELTVTFGYDGFNMNSLFSGYDANRMKYSISGTKALKLINGENRIFHVGEYVITIGISDAISEYTFSGIYNKEDIIEGIQSLQYRIIVKEREVNLPNDGNNILVSSESELEAAIRLFENNYWYTASYSVVQADGSIRPLADGELPQANGSYYVKLKLKDDDGNIKWCYGDGSGILADNEEEINLLINTDPVVAKPILKGEVAGVTTTTIHFIGQRIPIANLFENYLVQALESTITFNGVEVEYLYDSSEQAYIITVQPTGSYNWAGEEEGTEAAKAPVVYTVYVSKASVVKPVDVNLIVGSTDVPPFEYPISYENSLFYSVEGYSRTEDGPFNEELPMIGGLYFVRIILNDTQNSAWEDGTIEPVIVKYRLSQKVAVPSINLDAGADFFTYKAEAFRFENLLKNYVDAYTFDITYQTIDGVNKIVQEVKNAGIYTLSLTLYDGFTWETAFNGKLGPFTISQKEVNVTGLGQYKEAFGSSGVGIRTGLAANMGFNISGNLANDTDFGIQISFTATSEMLSVGDHTIDISTVSVNLTDAVKDNYRLINSITALIFTIETTILDIHFSETVTHPYNGVAFYPSFSFLDANSNQPLSLAQDVDYKLIFSELLDGKWRALTEAPLHAGSYKILIELLTTNYQVKENIILEKSFEIQKAAISVTGYSHGDGAYWIYDGTNTRQFPAIFTGGVIGEDINIFVSLTTPSANAATYNTPAAEVVFDEASLQDYSITIADSAHFSVTIAKAGVKVGAIQSLPYNSTKNYTEEDLGIQLIVDNENTPAPSAILTYKGEEIGTSLKSANDYVLTLRLTDSTNYYFSSSIDSNTTFTFDSETITQRKLASWTFTITKQEINAKVNPSFASIAYNGEEQEASIIFKYNTVESNWGDLTSLSYTLEYYTDIHLTNKINGCPINAGIYYVRLFLDAPDSENYSLILLNVLENRKFEITKRTLEISSKEYEKTFNNSSVFPNLSGLTIKNLPIVDTTTNLTVSVTADSSNVGTYSTIAGTLAVVFEGFDSNNYIVELEKDAFIQLKIVSASVEVLWKLYGSPIYTGASTMYSGEDITERLEATYTTLAGQVNRLDVAITGAGNRLLGAGTYTLTARFGSGSGVTASNYNLTNASISYEITPYTINASDLDDLQWMNVNAGNRRLVGGTYDVELEGTIVQITGSNAFAKYRGTPNQIEIALPTELPYTGITISGYQNNEKINKGSYIATVTLALSSTNYVWDSALNPSAENEVTLSKNWYIVDFTNALKTDFSTNGWVFGEQAVYTTPELELGGTLIYKLRNHLDQPNQINIDNITDLSIWLNSSMPAGRWTLTICVPAYTGIVEGVEVQYDGREIEVVFDIEFATLQLANKNEINNQIFTHVYNGLPQYIKDVTPDFELVEPIRTGGWTDAGYDCHYQAKADLALTYSNTHNGTYHEASLKYWQGAPIRVNTYTIYYQVLALNHNIYSSEENHFTVEITPKQILPTLDTNHSNISYEESILSWGYEHTFALTDIIITPDELYTVADGQGKGENHQDLVTFTYHFKNEKNEIVTNLSAGTYKLVLEVAMQAEAQNNNRNYTLGEYGYAVSVVVNQMEVEALKDLQISYTGYAIMYPVAEDELYEVESYSSNPISVGTYTVTFRFKDTAADNYIWKDGKNTAVLEIIPAILDVTVTLLENRIYTGSSYEAGVTFSKNGEAFVLTNGKDYTLNYLGEITGQTTRPVYADHYKAILELSNNFMLGSVELPSSFNKITDKKIEGSYEILKASISLSLIENHEHYYTGEDYNKEDDFFRSHYSIVNALANGIIPQENEFVISYSGTNGEVSLLDAGTYTLSYTLKGLGAQNFVIINGDSETLWNSTVIIRKAKISFDLADNARAVVYTYNQSSQEVLIAFENQSGTAALPTHYKISYRQNSIETEFKNVGSYEVVIALLAPDTKNFELIGPNPMVEMKSADIYVNASSSATYMGAGQEPIISFIWQDNQVLSLEKNTQYIVTYEGEGLDSNGLPMQANETGYIAKITIKDSNYHLVTSSFTFTITKAQISLGTGEYHYVGKTPIIQPRFINVANPAIIPTSYRVTSYKSSDNQLITAQQFLNVGTYYLTIELTEEDANNFELVDDCYEATIIPESLATITWANGTISLPAHTGSVSYNQNIYHITATGTFGDGTTKINLNVEIMEGQSQILNAGTYTLRASVPSDNPNINAITGDFASYILIVKKAIVELEITDNEVEYSKEEQAATIAILGEVVPTSSDYTVLYSAEGYNSSTGATDVDVYTVTVSFLENGNYEFVGNLLAASGTFTITKAKLSFSAKDKTYNGEEQEATIVFTWKDGETITFIEDIDYTISYEANTLPKEVHTPGYRVTLTLSPEVAKNYDLSEAQTTMYILPKSILVTGNGIYTEVYGESGTARIKNLEDVSNLTLSGIEPLDSVTGLVSFTIPNPSANTYADVHASILLTGESAHNYQLTSTELTITIIITKRQLTLTGIATHKEIYGNPLGANRTYTARELNLTLGNAIGNDSANLTIHLAFTLPSIEVNNYTISNSIITYELLDNDTAHNYEIGKTDVELDFEIEPAQIKVQFIGNKHIYSNTAYTPAVQLTYGTNNIYSVIPTESEYSLAYQTIVGELLDSAPKDAGEYKVIINLPSNYILEGSNSYEYVIEKYVVSLMGIQLNSGETAGWVYDGKIHSLEFDGTYASFVETNDPKIKVTLTTPSADAKTYTNLIPQITWSDSKNYDVVVDEAVSFSLTISKAELSIIAIPTAKPYIGYKKDKSYYDEEALKEDIIIQVTNSSVQVPDYKLTYKKGSTYKALETDIMMVDTYRLKLELSDKNNFTFAQGSALGGDIITYPEEVAHRTYALWNLEITKAQINAKIADTSKKTEYTSQMIIPEISFKHSDASDWGNQELATDVKYIVRYFTDSERTDELSNAPISVGTYYVKIEFTLENYELVLAVAENRVFEITPKELTIYSNAENPFTWTYNSSNTKDFILGATSMGATISGVFEKDEVEVTARLTSNAANKGTYRTSDSTLDIVFTLSGAQKENYTIPYGLEDYALTITAAEAKVVWELREGIQESLTDGYHFVYDGHGRINRIIPVISCDETGWSVEGAKEVKKNNVVVTTMIDAGTYVLTALNTNENYTLSNASIIVYVDPYTITQEMLDDLIWVNRSASDRQLVSGTYEVDGVNQTATNAFAKFRGSENVIELSISDELLKSALSVVYQDNRATEKGSYITTASFSLTSSNYQWGSATTIITKHWYIVDFLNGLNKDFEVLVPWMYGSIVVPGTTYVIPTAMHGGELSYVLSSNEFATYLFTDLDFWLNSSIPAGTYLLNVYVPESHGIIFENGTEVEVTYEAFEVSFEFTILKANIDVDIIAGSTHTHTYDGNRHVLNTTPNVTLENNQISSRTGGWASSSYDSYYQEEALIKFNTVNNNSYYELDDLHWGTAPINVNYVDGHISNYKVYFDIEALNYNNYSSTDADNHYVFVEIQPKEISLNFSGNNAVSFKENSFLWTYEDTIQRGDFIITSVGVIGNPVLTYKYTIKNDVDPLEIFTGDTSLSFNRNNLPSQAGTYTMEVVLGDSEVNRNYSLDQAYLIKTKIAQKKIIAPTNQEATYTGQEIGYSLSANEVYFVEAYSDTVINADSYIVTFKIKPEQERNYTWDTINTATLTIKPAKLVAMVENIEDVYYDRTDKEGVSISFRNAIGETIPIQSSSYVITYDGKLTLPRLAKDYAVEITLLNTNYELMSSGTEGYIITDFRTIIGTFSVLKAKISIHESQIHKHIYTGEDFNATNDFFSNHYAVTNLQGSGIIPIHFNGTSGYEVTYNGGTTLKDANTYILKYSLKGDAFDNFIIVVGDQEITEWSTTLEIEKAKIDISVDHHYIYNGIKQDVAITLTNQSGTTVIPQNPLMVSYKKDDETEFLTAGNYIVTVLLHTLDQNNFILNNNVIMVDMNKAEISVSTSKTSYYNGKNQEINLFFNSVERLPIVLTKDVDYQVIYQGNLTNGLPMNAGTYQVQIELLDARAKNYTLVGEYEAVYQILKARVSISADGSYVYTGTKQSITPRFSNADNTGVIPSQQPTITYSINQTQVDFLNAGAYAVELKLSEVDELNFELITSIIEVVIHKARIISVEWKNSDDLVYTGAVHKVTAIGTWGNNQKIDLEIEVSEGKEILNAGNYTVTAFLDNSNFEEITVPNTKTISVLQAVVRLSISNHIVEYTGKKQQAVIGFLGQSYPAIAEYSLEYRGQNYQDNEGAIDAGEYTLIVSLPQSGNYIFADGEYAASAAFTICPVELTGVISNSVYTGQPQNANIQLKNANGTPFMSPDFNYYIEYKGENLVNGLPQNVGRYPIVIHISENKNYTVNLGTNRLFEITPAVVSVNVIGTYSYTGFEQAVQLEFLNSHQPFVVPTHYDVTYIKGDEQSFLTAGEYVLDVILTEEDALNYRLNSTRLNVTLQKAEIREIHWNGVENLVYTGNSHTITASGVYGENQFIELEVREQDGKDVLNAGTYCIEAFLEDSNFTSLTKIDSEKLIVVKPALVSLSITNNHYIYDGEEKQATIKIVEEFKPEHFDITYILDDYISSTGAITAGVYEIVISLTENGNFSFEDGYTTISSLTIEQIIIGVQINFDAYTGQPQKAKIEFNLLPASQALVQRVSLSKESPSLQFVEGDDYMIEYHGEGLVGGLPVNAGTYQVTIVFISANAKNYRIEGSTDGRFTKDFRIEKAVIELVWSEDTEFASDAEIKTPYLYDGPWADMISVIYKDAAGNILDAAPEVGGEYTVEVQLKDMKNFELSGDVSKTFNIIAVNQADLTIYLWIIMFLLIIIVLLIIVIIILLKNRKNPPLQEVSTVDKSVEGKNDQEAVVAHDALVEDEVNEEEEFEDEEEEESTDLDAEQKPSLSLEEIEAIIQSYRDKYLDAWDVHAKEELNGQYDELMKGLAYYQRKPRMTFREKINKASPEVKSVFNEVKNEILSYQGVTNRVTKYYDVFYIGRRQIAKISLTNKKVKVYLAADPEKYPSFPHKNLSDKKSHARTPYYTMAKSQLSIRRIKKVVADIMESSSKEKNPNYEPIDHAIKLRFMTQPQN